jgi:hypothetical protein
MAKNDYKVLQGIDYPPNKRAEAGQVVSDLPKDSIPWLLESGIIERTGVTKESVTELKPVTVEDDAITVVEVADEL